MEDQEAESSAKVDLTATEKRIVLALDSEKDKRWDQKSLAERTGMNEDATMQTAFVLAQKGLCEVTEEKKVYYRLTEEGRDYTERGLPERRGLEVLPLAFQAFKNSFPTEKEATIATNWLLKKRWARFEERGTEKVLVPTGELSWGLPGFNLDEELLHVVRTKGQIEEEELVGLVMHAIPGVEVNLLHRLLDDLVKKRNLLTPAVEIERTIMITKAGHDVVSHGISIEEELTQLTPELLRTGSWKGRKFKRYDVQLPSKEEFPAKIHPYQRMLDRMRRIFTEMGFVEIKGDLIQTAFWNFDALFVPQDHPAREMQDTFYLGRRKPLDVSEVVIANVKAMHEHGGSLNSAGWGGVWKRELSEELLLRTHTTAVTLWYLASHPEPPVKVFSIDRVYRRETIDPTHVPEFEQLEGIVMDRGVTFSNLLGLLATFYKKMGFPSIRFRPSYFPYTEPSVEVEVYMPERGWLELGGAGVFREEVTNPIGVKYPVLAWGLGIGRLAMLSLGLTDIRDLYQSDIDWLRRSRIVR
ncbi:MAG: phenylalanine--tRNA ligase subunit alpha [Methanophagales archaeon ANME-1-THS]|nr:MAG: phenylalanine--tRNA ligase subunit alpha [Methanophagales archaeon ANME-1-THS]